MHTCIHIFAVSDILQKITMHNNSLYYMAQLLKCMIYLVKVQRKVHNFQFLDILLKLNGILYIFFKLMEVFKPCPQEQVCL